MQRGRADFDKIIRIWHPTKNQSNARLRNQQRCFGEDADVSSALLFCTALLNNHTLSGGFRRDVMMALFEDDAYARPKQRKRGLQIHSGNVGLQLGRDQRVLGACVVCNRPLLSRSTDECLKFGMCNISILFHPVHRRSCDRRGFGRISLSAAVEPFTYCKQCLPNFLCNHLLLKERQTTPPYYFIAFSRLSSRFGVWAFSVCVRSFNSYWRVVSLFFLLLRIRTSNGKKKRNK